MIRTNRTAADPVEELIQLAIELNLTALASGLLESLARAERQGMSFTDFGLKLLRAEVLARKNRRLERSLKHAYLGTVEGLEGFNFALRPQLEPRVVKELFHCRFVEDKRNILCLGRPGLGKTRIAKAIAHAACVAGYSTLYVVTAEMLEQLHASHADATFKRTLRKYIKPQLLVLDSFGYEPFDSPATTYLFRLVCARHRQGSIIITANTSFSQWKKLFPSEAQTVAIADRLIDQATVLRFTGKTCRTPREVTGAPLD